MNKKKDAPTDNKKKEDKTEATINLTTGEEQSKDWSEWDQNVDYSGLMFFSLGDDIDETKSDLTPDYEQLDVDVEHTFEQLSAEAKVNALWTLLNSQSTIDLFCTGKMLQNIHTIDIFLTVYSTGGVTKTNKIGFLPGYGWVWYHPGGLANILSLARVTKKF